MTATDGTQSRVEQLESAVAQAVSQLGDLKAEADTLEADTLEAELVAARDLADDWRDIAIQLAATCRDLRARVAAAEWETTHAL